MEFVIMGQLRSGKNGMQVHPTTHRHYPTPEWEKWRNQTIAQLLNQWAGKADRRVIDMLCTFDIRYYPGDLRTRDVPGMLDAIFHCFERTKIGSKSLLVNDGLIKNVTWRTEALDRKNPRTYIHVLDCP